MMAALALSYLPLTSHEWRGHDTAQSALSQGADADHSSGETGWQDGSRHGSFCLLLLATRRAKPETPLRMNRIEDRFSTLRQRGHKGLIIYLGAGDPDLARTRELVLALDRAGADCLELGVPFSDPLADGLVNQLAAQRGLASGTTPRGVLEVVSAIRRESQVPVVLYIYFNLIHRYGVERFVLESAQAGVDGILALDLPPEEAGHYESLMRGAGLCNIYLVAPTTPDERMATIAARARGFLYYVSREGVTGMQQAVAADLAAQLVRIRAHTTLPVAVGFGISNAEQARSAAALADAVVVGSAVVDRIARHGQSPDLTSKIAEFVSSLAQAVRTL
jgi:tryptophan synthase alpha chain